MRACAVLLVLGIFAGCHHADPAEVALTHDEVRLLGAMARAPGPRSAAQVASITDATARLQAHVDSIAGVKT